MKIRICRITSEFPPPWSGLTPGPFALSLAQFRNGVDLAVITKEKMGAGEVDTGLPFPVERLSSRFDAEFSFKAYSKFRALDKIHPFNLVHAHGFSSIGILLAKKFGTCKTPVITTMHCVRRAQRKSQKEAFRIQKHNIMSDCKIPAQPYLLWEALQEKFVIKNSDRICAVSDGVRKNLIDLYSLPQDKVYVVGNGVDISQFKPGISRPLKRQNR